MPRKHHTSSNTLSSPFPIILICSLIPVIPAVSTAVLGGGVPEGMEALAPDWAKYSSQEREELVQRFLVAQVRQQCPFPSPRLRNYRASF
jgi:hypothetical protein